MNFRVEIWSKVGMFSVVGIGLYIAKRRGLPSFLQGRFLLGIFGNIITKRLLRSSDVHCAVPFIASFLVVCLSLSAVGFGQISAVNSNAIVANLNSSGYLTLPTLNGLGGDMTIEGWVYLNSYSSWARIADLGMGQQNDNILLEFNDITGKPEFEVYNVGAGSAPALNLIAPTAIPLKTWTHVAGVIQSDGTMMIYVNGVKVATSTGKYLPPNSNRTSNLIGKSNWSFDP